MQNNTFDYLLVATFTDTNRCSERETEYKRDLATAAKRRAARQERIDSVSQKAAAFLVTHVGKLWRKPTNPMTKPVSV